MLSVDLARAVGEEGSVIGVDPSEDMLASARARGAGLNQLRFVTGTDTDTTLDTGATDTVISLQVFEYLPDIPAALAEIHRVLRPGGRVVIGDMMWDSLVWASDDAVRMRRVQDAWDRHLSDTAVPVHLCHDLVTAGFEVDAVTPVGFIDTDLRPDGLANMLRLLICGYLRRNGLLPEEEIAAWDSEQRARAREGRFFFSLTHVVISARKTGVPS